MMDKFYAQHQIFRIRTAGVANLRHVFGAVELARQNAAGSNSPRAQKGTPKHNVYSPKFVEALKNFLSIFP